MRRHSTAWRCALVAVILASYEAYCQDMPGAHGPQAQAPAPSGEDAIVPAPVPALGSLTGSIYQEIKVEPYIDRTNATLPNTFIVMNNTYRFVDRNLTAATDAFKQAVSSAFHETVGNDNVNLDLEFSYYASIGAPIIGPDAVRGGNPAPSVSPQPFGGPFRKLLQGQPNPADDWKNYNSAYRSMDVRLVCRGGRNSSILQINQPAQLRGYVEVKLSQAGIQATMLPLTMDFGKEIEPVVQSMPLYPIYVLGTVLEGHGTGFYPVNVEMQNILLTALNSMLGSQQTFLWNEVVAVWQDSASYTIRVAFRTYLKTPLTDIDQIAGGSTAAFMDQLAHQIQANFSVIVLSSGLLGTHLEEIAGDPKFNIDPSQAPVAINPRCC